MISRKRSLYGLVRHVAGIFERYGVSKCDEYTLVQEPCAELKGLGWDGELREGMGREERGSTVVAKAAVSIHLFARLIHACHVRHVRPTYLTQNPT